MKRIATLMLALVLSSSTSLALAHTGALKDMDMKDMDQKTKGKAANAATHEAAAVVKNVDAASGKATLAHEPIKSLNWPAMTMAFAVKDKTLLEKLAVGNQVHVEFNKQGSDYVLTKVK